MINTSNTVWLHTYTSGKSLFINQDAVEIAYREDFVEWYERHVTVMNILEYPYIKKTGHGIFPAYDLLEITNLKAENIDAGAVVGSTYTFIIQTESDPSPVSVTLNGGDIATYADVIRLLENGFPNVEFQYNQTTEEFTHSITCRSKFEATERKTVLNESNGQQTYQGIDAPSTIHITKFGEETSTTLVLEEEKTEGQQAEHPPIRLAEIKAAHILLQKNTGHVFRILRGDDSLLEVQYQDVDNMQDVIEWINEKFDVIVASFFTSYTSTVPTHAGEATMAYENDPLVFGLIIHSALPSKEEFVAVNLLTAEEQEELFRSGQQAKTWLSFGSAALVEFINYETGIAQEYTILKKPKVANGISLHNVLAGTELSEGDGTYWIPDGMKPKIYDPRYNYTFREVMDHLISLVPNPFAAFGKKLKDFGVNAAKVLGDMAKLAAAGVVAAATAIGKLVDVVTGLVSGAISNIISAIAALGSAVVDFIKGVISDIVLKIQGWFETPPSIDDRLFAIQAKIDNGSFDGYLPDPAPPKSAEETKLDEIETQVPVTDESPAPGSKITPVNPIPEPGPDRGGLTEA